MEDSANALHPHFAYFWPAKENSNPTHVRITFPNSPRLQSPSHIAICYRRSCSGHANYRDYNACVLYRKALAYFALLCGTDNHTNTYNSPHLRIFEYHTNDKVSSRSGRRWLKLYNCILWCSTNRRKKKIGSILMTPFLLLQRLGNGKEGALYIHCTFAMITELVSRIRLPQGNTRNYPH